MKLAVVGLLVVATIHLSDAGKYCFWLGTSPFCQGWECPAQFYQTELSTSGDGATCWTGVKSKCCINLTQNVTAETCRWMGEAPFNCNQEGQGCPDDSGIEVARDQHGDGATCPTSYSKPLCCQPAGQ